ncbi:hypothetical protein NIES4073_15290 [Kalymmatonema gypsitolerans NIES-4073]|nr:hypothetical protein NIES4073_15290 [Scytonema sp. NIES-4073]
MPVGQASANRTGLTIAGFLQLPFGLMPIRSYTRSTDCHGVSHRQNLLCCVDVPVMACPTVGAIPFPYIQRQTLKDVTAIPTAFITGKPSVNFYQGISFGDAARTTIPLGFVFELSYEFTPASITDSTGKFRVFDHVFNEPCSSTTIVWFSRSSRVVSLCKWSLFAGMGLSSICRKLSSSCEVIT